MSLINRGVIWVLLYISHPVFGQNLNIPITALRELKQLDWNYLQSDHVKTFDSIFLKHDILILAEADHGHGSSMDAQIMILNELIEANKISSLYIESSRLNCEKIMSLLKEKGKAGIEEAEKYFRSYELLYWKKVGFWNYLADKIIDGKIKLYGFDIDGISPLIIEELYNEALELKSIKKLRITDTSAFKAAYVNLGFGFLGWGPNSTYFIEYHVVFKRFVDMVIQEYTSAGNIKRVKQWQSVLNFFYWMVVRLYPLKGNKYMNQIENKKQLSAYNSVRDSLMAESFMEQYNEEKEAKVACSMSAYHALRGSYTIDKLDECCKSAEIKTMTEIIDKKLDGKIYSICFITGSGEYGIIKFEGQQVGKIKKPVKNSLEYSLNKKNISNCFIDLGNPDWITGSFCMNILFNTYLKSVWSKNYSAVFYIKRMKPLILY